MHIKNHRSERWFGVRLFIDKPCDPRAFDLHGALGTKFLTAEACDASFCVDHGNAVLHYDRSGRAYLRAFFATDAKLFDGLWRSTEGGAYEHCSEFSRSFKLQTATHVNIFVVVDDKWIGVACDTKL